MLSTHPIMLMLSLIVNRNSEALSYTWGFQEDLDTIYIEQNSGASTLHVTSSLVLALRYLRYSDRPRTLWVDAICINQQDEVERNSQVSQIGTLYALASQVIVWLGPESEDSKHAISTLPHLGEQVECAQGWKFQSPEAIEPRWYDRGFPLPFDARTWSAVTAFFRRKWFTRVWTLQEIHRGHSCAVVRCGHDSISWYHLRRAILAMDAKNGLTEELTILIRRAQVAACSSSNFSVRRLLSSVKSRECTDHRDKIYGLLSIMPVSFAKRIQPQYSLSVAEVFKNAFLVHLDSVQRLELLPYGNINHTLPEGPSWVPNWGVEVPPSSIVIGMAQPVAFLHL